MQNTQTWLKGLSEKQMELVKFIQELDPSHRHQIQIECRGTEPCKFSRVSQPPSDRPAQGYI